MASWVCAGCATVYSVDALRCPHCGSTDYHEDGTMPKIRIEGGATNAALAVADAEAPATPEEEPSPGNSSSTSPESTPTNSEPSAPAPRKRARTTASPSSQDPTDASTAPGTDGDPTASK